MKKYLLFTLTLIVLAGLMPIGKAQAAQVNYDAATTTVNMGTILADSDGAINTATQSSSAGYTFDSIANSSLLSPYTSIIFTYTVKSSVAGTSNFLLSGTQNDINIGATDWVILPSLTVGKFTTYVYQANLIIENLTNALANISSQFVLGPISPMSPLSLPSYFTVTTGYTTVANMSAVPLPAALPLFGLGLAGLAGFKRLRKNKASV